MAKFWNCLRETEGEDQFRRRVPHASPVLRDMGVAISNVPSTAAHGLNLGFVRNSGAAFNGPPTSRDGSEKWGTQFRKGRPFEFGET
jgi:hypothetical protein